MVLLCMAGETGGQVGWSGKVLAGVIPFFIKLKDCFYHFSYGRMYVQFLRKHTSEHVHYIRSNS